MIRMQSYIVRMWTLSNGYNSFSFVIKFRIQFRTSSQTIANIRHGIVLDRLTCKLASHNLITCDPIVYEHNANTYRLFNVMKRMLTNDERTFYSPHNVQHAQNISTNKTNCNGCKRSQTHTYELHNDGDEHILIGTNFTQVLFASTSKLTSGDVRLCVLTSGIVRLCVRGL